MRLRIVKKGDGMFEVQLFNHDLDAWSKCFDGTQARFTTYDEATSHIKKIKYEIENKGKMESVIKIYDEVEI